MPANLSISDLAFAGKPAPARKMAKDGIISAHLGVPGSDQGQI
jgi:hypothetical protein